MNWNILDIAEIDTKWNEWDRLNRLYYDNHPYFDSRFIKPCIKYFCGDAVKLAELRNDRSEISGMILLEKKKYGIWSLFVPAQLQIAPVLLDPANSARELHYLLKLLPELWCRLECLDQDMSFSPFSEKQDKYTIKYHHCTTTSIELNSTFIDFWGKRKKKIRQNIKRYFNRIDKNNIKIVFRKLSEPEDLKAGLIRYGLLESLGWKGKKGTAIHPDNVQGSFYDEVLQSFGQTNQASIYEFYLDDQLAASRLCINNERMSIMLKVTFNENLKKFAPGKLLTYKMIENEFLEKKHKTIEFYTNATKDQIDWASSTRDIYHFEVYRNIFMKKLIKLKNRK